MKPGTKAERGKRIGNLPERLGEPLEVQMLIRLTVIRTLCAHVCSVVSELATPRTSPTGSSVHAISQAKILDGLPFPSPGDLPDPVMEPTSPALVGEFFTTEQVPGKSHGQRSLVGYSS